MYWVERVFKHRGLICVGTMGDLGHRCGYVGVPENHFLYGVEYHEKTEKLGQFKEQRLTENVSEDDIGIMTMFFAMCEGELNLRPDVFLSVHGGLTFSGKGPYPIDLIYARPWWFGFDCGHCDDGVDPEYMPESRRQFFCPDDRPVRSVEYIEEQCIRLANQLYLLDQEYALTPR